MNLLHQTTIGARIAALTLLLAPPLQAEDISYHYLKEIAVGGETWWDYLTIDAEARRLYVSHHSRYDVIDLNQDAVVGTITDTPGCHGFAFASDLKLGFTCNGQEGKSSIVDLSSLKTTSKISTGEKPDSILYDPKAHQVSTFNGVGHSVTVYDAESGKVEAIIPLPGKPEFAQLDPGAGQIYVNVEDKNLVDIIDTATHRIVKEWPVSPGVSCSSMAIDPAHHRLFIGCGNKTLVAMDATNGKIVATIPIGAGVDATVFDPGNQLIFSSCGEDGLTNIVREDDPDHYSKIQTLATAPGARTMAVDPVSHNIYFASSEPDRSHLGQAGKLFRILIYGMAR